MLSEMGLLLFLIASAFILFILIINLTNLVKIKAYCFDTILMTIIGVYFYEGRISL